MKRIFLLNNHIMCLMALKIIETEAIPADSVIFLLVRNYTLPDIPRIASYKTVDYSDFFDRAIAGYSGLLKIFRQRKKYSAQISAADSLVKEALGGENEFILYLPHSNILREQMLISMPQCKGVFFVEEGTLAYAITKDNNKFNFSFKTRLFFRLSRFMLSRRHGNLYFCSHFFAVKSPLFRGFYCCHQNAFRDFEKRILISPPFTKLEQVLPDLHAVLVFDAGIVSEEHTIDYLNHSIQYAKEKRQHSHIYYKFHPAQNTDCRTRLRQKMQEAAKQHNIVAKELPDSMVLENLAFTLKDKLDMFIICSSVGLYSFVCGANVFTTAKRYTAQYPQLQNHYDAYGNIFNLYTEI